MGKLRNSEMRLSLITFFLLITAAPGCGKLQNGFINMSQSGERFLYVASGTCYAGGVVGTAGTGLISRYSLEDGKLESEVINYGTVSPSDMPVGLARYDADRLLVGIENANGRRLDLLNVRTGAIEPFYVNATVLATQLRALTSLPSGGYLVARSTMIEKFSSFKTRVLTPNNLAFVNAPAGACATSTTAMVGATEVSGGKVLYIHAGVSPNNKIGMTSASGYSSAADCLTTQAAPATTALPTSIITHSSGKVLVSYGSTTGPSNSIHAYDVDANANTISGATASYANSSVVLGPSAMVENTTDQSVYVANAAAGAESIEKFTFDSSSKTLTRVGGSPFISTSLNIRCVSGMAVSEW